MKKLILVVLICMLAGCSAKSRYKPEVSLINAWFSKIEMFESEVMLDVRFTNDSPRQINIKGASHKVYLNGVYLGKALSKESFSIPAFESVKGKAALTISNLRMLTRVQKLLESRGVEYELESTIYLDNGRAISSKTEDSFVPRPNRPALPVW